MDYKREENKKVLVGYSADREVKKWIEETAYENDMPKSTFFNELMRLIIKNVKAGTFEIRV